MSPIATSEILLDLQDRVDPPGNAPGTTTTTSTGATTTNAIALRLFTLDFDPTTDETTSWHFRMPSNYSSGGTLTVSVICMATATGKFQLKCSSFNATVSTTKVTTASYAAVDTFTATSVSSTTGVPVQVSKALTSPGFAAGRPTWIMLGRDADDVADTCPSDINVTDVTFSYTV